MRIVLTIVFSLIAQSAWAATTTDRHVLGFSKDGRYFVFEEFAVGDGAGIPTATLYVIDTTNDSWAPGSPFTTNRREDDVEENPDQDWAEAERELIASVRAEIREMAGKLLKEIGPLVPGTQRVRNTVFDFTTDATSARFSTLDYIQTIKGSSSEEKWKLELENIAFPVREDCYDLTETMNGIRLRLTDEAKKTSRILSEDRRIPTSRPCPFDNKIEEVITHPLANNGFVLAVLIRYAHPGFEGADGSLLAITSRIEN